MLFLSRILFSKYDQPLVNSVKNSEVPKSNPQLIQGIPYTKAGSVSTVQGAATSDASTTRSRADFAKAWKSLHERQEYHLKQLKAGKPVHISGRYDVAINTVLYASSGFGFLYCMYLLGGHIRQT